MIKFWIVLQTVRKRKRRGGERDKTVKDQSRDSKKMRKDTQLNKLSSTLSTKWKISFVKVPSKL